SHTSTALWEPMRVSRAAMSSPSRMTTRSTPRTSRAFALSPSRRAAPTSARPASGPGQVTSRAEERPGSVSEPWARTAPRQADGAAPVFDETGLAGQGPAVAGHTQQIAVRAANAGGIDDGDIGVLAVEVLDLGPEPFRGLSGVELGFEHDRTVDQVQRGGEAEDRGHLGPARGGAGDLHSRQLILDLSGQCHSSSSCT